MSLERVKQGLLGVLTGVMPVFIAACYGPQRDDYFAINGTVKDPNLKPIPNILVRCMRGAVEVDSTYSHPGDGKYRLQYQEAQPCDTLTFKDIDGTENGGKFADKSVKFDHEDAGPSFDVTLEPE